MVAIAIAAIVVAAVYWAGENQQVAGTGSTTNGPANTTPKFAIDSVNVLWSYAYSSSAFFGDGGNVCSQCPQSWPVNYDWCAGGQQVLSGGNIDITNQGSATHDVTDMTVTWANPDGLFWTGTLEDSEAQGAGFPISVPPGQTSPYDYLLLGLGGSCGDLPSGSFNITIYLGAQ